MTRILYPDPLMTTMDHKITVRYPSKFSIDIFKCRQDIIARYGQSCHASEFLSLIVYVDSIKSRKIIGTKKYKNIDKKDKVKPPCPAR